MYGRIYMMSGYQWEELVKADVLYSLIKRVFYTGVPNKTW